MRLTAVSFSNLGTNYRRCRNAARCYINGRSCGIEQYGYIQHRNRKYHRLSLPVGRSSALVVLLIVRGSVLSVDVLSVESAVK